MTYALVSNLKRLFIVVCLLVIVGTIPSEARSLNGENFPDHISIAATPMHLSGLTLKRFLFIKVFVAGLYLGENVPAEKALSDVPKRIEVHYLYGVPGKKLAVETRRRIALNVTADQFQKLKERIDRMDRFYVNIKSGDYYSLTYIPGQGTQFHYNDELKGTIPGADFASALFSVWVGAKPLDANLKSDLLGQTPGSAQ